ncbi:hypothetical protein EV127DRAFT_480660 [Xylaria flabelliformis]|nr:hypothetical protein EV127DRAFT_480660 [Xylaria flabelliformis]
MDDAEDKAEESEENISPDAGKSEIRFTLQRRRDRNGNNDNSGNERDSNRQGRNRGGDDNNQDRRSGREGDNGRSSRFRGGGDGGPPFFREENDGGGGKPGDNADGSGNGDGKGDSRDGGKGGNGKGGSDNNGQSKGAGGGGDNGGNGSGDSNDGGGGNDNNNEGGKGGRGGRGGDGGRGGPGGDRGGSDPSPPPPSPPPSTTTTVESTTSEVSTTTSEVSTSTSTSEATTTTTSSVLQTNTIPLLTALPALADTTPTSLDSPILVPSEGALEPTPILTSASVTDIADFTTLAPTQTNTNPANGSGRGNGRHRGGGNNNDKGNDGEGGLNPTSERILIAAGSIGAFIVFLFIGWMVYRTLKKSKQPDRHDSKSWLSKLIPFRGRSAESNAKALDNSYEPKESLPAYDFGNNNSMEAFGYYDQGKFAPLGSEGIVYQSMGTLQNGRAVWQTPEAQQPLQPQASLQNQYSGIADQMVDMSDVNSTMRSRMPGPYYNQSEFARQPSDAYNPAQRQVYRASEISSLSSGFGDGDIIMPPPNIIPKPPTAPVTNNTEINNRPFSWMSRTGSVKKRETVSTTVSEHPIRFRSVNSWVDQQKERLRRANSRTRGREEVPAIPQISYK